MTLHMELYQVLTLALAIAVPVITAFWALAKMIAGQFERRLDERFVVQDKARSEGQADWNRRFEELRRDHNELDGRFIEHLQMLPEKYQRREDAIRQEVAIVSRLDGLAGMVERRFEATNKQIEGLRSS